MSNKAAAKVMVIGTRWLGAEVLKRLHSQDLTAALIAVKPDDKAAQMAQDLGVPYRVKPDAVPLMAMDFPWRPDLIVCAHSFRIVEPWVINWASLGAIGYHPSLLPAFKGRRAVQDALDAGRRITGGSVYWLTEAIDGGPVVVAGGRRLQDQVQVLPNETASELWRRALAPLGVRLLTEGVISICQTDG
ncbi:methionyl-tRNA formyltransferase [Pseudorhodobacter sp. E13]|uniref:formyltransferase family protein n=1 Tax=Pseudorhodobacter sp. E13 TaxID=2487931 RepID=UPI000F8EB96F|nr:formyltransferase family protein [Pseudorhodobacter sp. E13]RUS64912.1 methionyl-tRNA formyltransferase [Pseudorhodobacter sp. E13]